MSARLIDIKEVSHKTSLGKSWIYAEMRAGRFPKAVKLAERCVRWVDSEIDEWITARAAERPNRRHEARND